MTTIAPRIKKILAIVEELKEAVRDKGVDVPETALFPELPDYIKQIVTLDFDFTEIITDTFSGTITIEIPDVTHVSSGFSGTITDSQILYSTSGFTIVGSPSISNDGLVSGFSTSSYLTASDIFTSSLPALTMRIRFKTGSSKVQQTLLLQNKGIIAEIGPDNVLYLWNWGSSSTANTLYTVEADTWYYLEITRDLEEEYATTYNLYADYTGALLASATYTDTGLDFTYADTIGIGIKITDKSYPFLGTIDLNYTRIYNITDGIEWQPSVTITDLTL